MSVRRLPEGVQLEVAFGDATSARSAAAVDNPDHVAIVIITTAGRLGAAGESQYDDLERRLADLPAVTVPAITLEGDHDAPYPDASAYAGKFTGKYAQLVIGGGGSHNLPQEAMQSFAQAVIDANGFCRHEQARRHGTAT